MQTSIFKDIFELLCKDHPNRKIFIISDNHFYHKNIINYEREEFKTIDEMHKHIINAHNQTVGKDDIVIFLGDFSFKTNKIKELLDKMNGNKYIILGNHDNESIIKKYKDLGFERVFTTPVKLNNDVLSHYPLNTDELNDLKTKLLLQEFEKTDYKNYHGHIHTKDKGNDKYINVCCEATNYKPLLIGYTEGLLKKNDLPLIINSNDFEIILEILRKEKNLDPTLVISDYLYANMLAIMNDSKDSYFCYGSYPLYKKYGFNSNFSDLDIGYLEDKELSVRKNISNYKHLIDSVYEQLKDIDGLNLSFYKRLSRINIFNALYAKNGYTYNAYFDSNFIPLDVYRETDFITGKEKSTLETSLPYKYRELIEGYNLPEFESKFLNIYGDISNIILQILFQTNQEDKKTMSLKKLKYIYRTQGLKDEDMTKDLEDYMMRYFIRNYVFLQTLRRTKDIRNLKEGYYCKDKLFENISPSLQEQLSPIILDDNSRFNKIYKELLNTQFQDIPKKGKELIKTIKESN